MIFSLFVKRALASATVAPTSDDIKHIIAGTVVCWAVLATSVKARMFKWQPMRSPRALGWAATYMLLRALLEELIFRALMLPHPKVDSPAMLVPARFIMTAIVPVVLFVGSHSFTTQRLGGTVLSDTQFLSTVALVGVVCSWAYWVTAGALWAAVAMHYLTVFPWMVLLGGHRKTHTPTPLKAAGPRDMAPSGPTVESKQE